MSTQSQAALLKLTPPVKDLVAAASQDGCQDFGKSEEDKAEVIEWIEKVARGDITNEASLLDLDVKLVPRTYIVGNYLTVADVALYGALQPVFSRLQPHQYFSRPSLTRYFDHIQSRPSVRASADTLSPTFNYVSLDFSGAPRAERKAEPSKKKEKVANKSTDTVVRENNETAAANMPTPADIKGQKKEKKEKGGAVSDEARNKKVGGVGKAATEEPGEPVPSMIDLRVGHIIDVKKHPDADGLYVEQIDIGEDTGPRTVVSGLVHYIPIEEMRDKYLVAVCNLKPANMRGVKSFAMVLCATSKDGKEGGIELLQPPPNSKPGDRVYFEGSDFENAIPVPQLNPKKKIFETIQPGFITLDTKEAAWVNPLTKSLHKIRTKNGVCLAPTLVGASLS